MDDLQTYRIEDFLMFAPRTYYRLLEAYNRDWWPLHLLALLAGVAIFLAVVIHQRPTWSLRLRTALLAAAWFQVAWAFHLGRYAEISWVARWFAAAFALQGVMLVVAALIERPDEGSPTRLIEASGLFLLGFAIVGLPVVELAFGRPWTRLELFGLFPDATAIATLGVVVVGARSRWHLLLIPMVWCAIGGATLFAMSNPEAGFVVGAGVFALALTIWKALSRRAAVRSIP